MNLWQDFLTNDQKIIDKWSHYFPVYERHFSGWRNKSIIFIEIGDQSDHAFLQSVMDEFGVPDIVLDDGSHLMQPTLRSFQFFYPKMPKNAIYLVEDLHTAYWEEYGGGPGKPDTFIHFAKQCVDQLNADHARGKAEPDVITRETFAISFYDSIVCFEKGDVWWKSDLITGKNL